MPDIRVRQAIEWRGADGQPVWEGTGADLRLVLKGLAMLAGVPGIKAVGDEAFDAAELNNRILSQQAKLLREHTANAERAAARAGEFLDTLIGGEPAPEFEEPEDGQLVTGAIAKAAKHERLLAGSKR
jgi:hypothetical protein